MTCFKKFMQSHKVFAAVDAHLADDEIIQATGSGDFVASMNTPQGMEKGVLTNVWHISKLSRNRFSVGSFTKDVGPVTFTKSRCDGEDKETKRKIGVREGKRLLYLQMTPVTPEQANAAKSSGCQEDTEPYL